LTALGVAVESVTWISANNADVSIVDDIIKLLLQYDYDIEYTFQVVKQFNRRYIKMFLDYGLNISKCDKNFIQVHGFESYIQFHYYVKYCKTQILKELLKCCHDFQYRETSIRAKINLLHLNIKYKNYTLNELQENYKDIIDYLNVLDIEHLKHKIEFFID